MTIWQLFIMEKCIRTTRSRRRITIQIIVDVVIFLAVAVPLLYLFLAGVPHDRGFFCDDDTIKYPYKPDSISTTLLLIVGFGTSLVVIIFVEVSNLLEKKCETRFKLEDLIYIIKCYCVFVVGFVVDQMFVEVIKNETGSLRPNFMDVCRPQFNSSLCPGYIMEYRCTGEKTVDDVRESRQSFPSGHAAFSMYIAVYLCLYIHKRLQITFSQTLKVIVQSGLIFMATTCGFSRIADHKHHMIDVICGFILGSLVALLMFKTISEKIQMSRAKHQVHFRENVEEIPCCTCQHARNFVDPTTPTPLLSMEYMNGNVTDYTGQHHPLHNVKYDVRRHMSMPNTSTVQQEIV